MGLSNFLYLGILIFTVSVPALLMFDKRSRYVDKLREVGLATLAIAIPFILWDIYFTRIGVWSFSYDYTLPMRLFGLPIEEISFFFAVPFACVFIYVSIEYYHKDRLLSKNVSAGLMLLAAMSILFAFLNSSLIYTFIMLLLNGVFLAAIAFSTVAGRSLNFWIYIGLGLVGFIIVNSVLTGVPIVSYDDSMNLGIRIGTIPIEDFFYYFLMNGSVLYIYRKLVGKFH